MKKNKFELLPHIREDVYGLSGSSAQILGWQIKKLDIETQWDYSEGDGVKIAVIDTGCDLNHPDIKNNLLDGINLIDKNKPPMDDNGHGSHVCGTIAAENNGEGVVGVAPKAKIMPVKALDGKGQGSLKSIVDGIVWASDNGADFITMSLGSPNPAQPLQDALKYATNKGCIIFCAAGNSGENSDISYPAKYPETISVGAIDENFERTSFTCSGEDLDFLAPGHNILSLIPGNYSIMSGTSMSNPFAVGCAALLLSYNRKHKKYSLTNNLDYINVLKEHTLKIPNPRYQSKKYQGYGIIRGIF